MPTALIAGIAGQDGSYPAELLLAKGYRIIGTEPDFFLGDDSRIRHLIGKVDYLQDDLLDQECIEKIFLDCRPDEVYNFAANSVLAARRCTAI